MKYEYGVWLRYKKLMIRELTHNSQVNILTYFNLYKHMWTGMMLR